MKMALASTQVAPEYADFPRRPEVIVNFFTASRKALPPLMDGSCAISMVGAAVIQKNRSGPELTGDIQ
jgi:hypothetical protein